MDVQTEHTLLEKRQHHLAQQFPLHTRTIDNREFSYRTAGTGAQTIIMLHGIGSSSASWFDTAMLLQNNARLIAWDAPGYGQSSALDITHPKATDYAHALHQLLEYLRIQDFLLVAHSLGALIGAAYTTRHAQAGQIAHFIMVSPAHGYGGYQSGKEAAARVRNKRLSIINTLGIEGMAHERAGHLVSPRASHTAREWVHWNMSCLHADGYRQAVELLCGDDITNYAPSPVPISIYCGDADDITPPDSCQQIAARYGTALGMIPHAGHASHIETPDEIAARVQKTLLSLRGK